MTEQRDKELLRRAIALSEEAVASGGRPFGAVICDGEGQIVAEARTSTRQFPDANCVKVATRVHSDFREHYVCTEWSKRVQTCAISSSLECTRSLLIPLRE
jgi:tRNA(Arg) A34 adenosine deaminase TadA